MREQGIHFIFNMLQNGVGTKIVFSANGHFFRLGNMEGITAKIQMTKCMKKNTNVPLQKYIIG